VVVDATPAGVGKENKKKYDALGVKSIFEGGESHDLTGRSFVAEVNYEKIFKKESVRVVSCNTTALCRILNPFVVGGLLEKAYVVLARRGSDPVDSHKKGPLGTLLLEKTVPSHHTFDARTVIPNLPVLTVAYAIPTTIGHLHTVVLRLTKEVKKEEIIKILKANPRIVGIGQELNILAQNQLVELMRDMGRPRADMWEVAFWEEPIYVDGKDVCFYYQVHNEAIVVPENIDAIRALTGLESRADRSIVKTNASLGMKTKFIR
jgi:glyceraldehyde-3-phosphate dehydrogenase (NAD(P))